VCGSARNVLARKRWYTLSHRARRWRRRKSETRSTHTIGYRRAMPARPPPVSACAACAQNVGGIPLRVLQLVLASDRSFVVRGWGDSAKETPDGGVSRSPQRSIRSPRPDSPSPFSHTAPRHACTTAIGVSASRRWQRAVQKSPAKLSCCPGAARRPQNPQRHPFLQASHDPSPAFPPKPVHRFR